MIDDMMMRKLSPKTQSGYIRAVKNLARYLGHSPDTATAEDLRKYQLSLVNDGISRITLNANLTALKFFFVTTLDCADALTKISTVPIPRKLPVVLSKP
jgi:site-specific recombinase XerD